MYNAKNPPFHPFAYKLAAVEAMLIYDYYTAKSSALHSDPLQVTEVPPPACSLTLCCFRNLMKVTTKTVKMEALTIKLPKNLCVHAVKKCFKRHESLSECTQKHFLQSLTARWSLTLAKL